MKQHVLALLLAMPSLNATAGMALINSDNAKVAYSTEFQRRGVESALW